jgi:hypothetical protein
MLIETPETKKKALPVAKKMRSLDYFIATAIKRIRIHTLFVLLSAIGSLRVAPLN